MASLKPKIEIIESDMSNSQSKIVQSMKLFFGMFMVLVYLGMAWLLLLNIFDWNETPLWNAVRYFFALVFGAYGIYRGYREFRGQHTYGMRQYDDSDEEPGYTTYDKVAKDNKTDDSHDQEK